MWNLNYIPNRSKAKHNQQIEYSSQKDNTFIYKTSRISQNKLPLKIGKTGPHSKQSNKSHLGTTGQHSDQSSQILPTFYSAYQQNLHLPICSLILIHLAFHKLASEKKTRMLWANITQVTNLIA